MNVTLAELVLDLRVRDTDPAAVADYSEAMEAGVRFPPIMVFRYADGSLHLADGFHRTAAALRAGLTTLPALVQGGGRETALRYALGANRANGQRRTAQDIRQAVAVALKEWPALTQAEVASLIGCSQPTVARVKADVIQVNNTEVPAVRVDSIGRTQPTVKPRAPAPKVSPATQADPSWMRQPAFSEAVAKRRAILAADPALANELPAFLDHVAKLWAIVDALRLSPEAWARVKVKIADYLRFGMDAELDAERRIAAILAELPADRRADVLREATPHG